MYFGVCTDQWVGGLVGWQLGSTGVVPKPLKMESDYQSLFLSSSASRGGLHPYLERSGCVGHPFPRWPISLAVCI